jgi:hypothetical protein
MAMLRTEIRPGGVGVRGADGNYAFVDHALQADGAGLHEAWGRALHATGLAGAGARVAVGVDNAFCWLDSVEGDFAALRPRVVEEVADAAFAEVLGEAIDDHERRWQVQRDGRHMLLLAMPRTLIAAIDAAAAAHGLRIASLNACFVEQWNECGRTAAVGDGVVALVRRGCATLVRVRDGVITALSCEHVSSSVSELDQATRRLLSRFGDDVDATAQRVLVSADAWSADKLGAWTLHRPQRGARSARP